MKNFSIINGVKIPIRRLGISLSKISERLFLRNPPSNQRNMRRLMMESAKTSIPSRPFNLVVEQDRQHGIIPDFRSGALPGRRHLAKSQGPEPPNSARPKKDLGRTGKFF